MPEQELSMPPIAPRYRRIGRRLDETRGQILRFEQPPLPSDRILPMASLAIGESGEMPATLPAEPPTPGYL